MVAIGAFDWIITKVFVDRRSGNQRARSAPQERVAVRLRACDCLGTNGATGPASTILNDDRLTKRRLQLFGDMAKDALCRSTWWEWVDDLDGLGRIGLGYGRLDHEHAATDGGEDRQNSALGNHSSLTFSGLPVVVQVRRFSLAVWLTITGSPMAWSERIGRRIRLRDIQILLAVVQCGNMTKAAKRLAISKPVVSKVIADLEYVVGVRLLDRDRHGAEPTIYGAALIKHDAAAFDELKQGVQEIEFLTDPTVGELRVGATAPCWRAFCR